MVLLLGKLSFSRVLVVESLILVKKFRADVSETGQAIYTAEKRRRC
jgi:hypothetical protein